VSRREGETARDMVDRTTEAGHDALLLRLCDRLDGTRRCAHRPEPKGSEFIEETYSAHLVAAREHFPALARLLEAALTSAEKGIANGRAGGSDRRGQSTS